MASSGLGPSTSTTRSPTSWANCNPDSMCSEPSFATVEYSSVSDPGFTTTVQRGRKPRASSAAASCFVSNSVSPGDAGDVIDVAGAESGTS